MPTSETTFCLAFGNLAIISAEVGLTSYRVTHYDERRNEEGMHLQLDLLDEVRATTKQRITHCQDLKAKHCNTKVKPRNFQVEDLVLRKVTIATKDLKHGKLGLN